MESISSLFRCFKSFVKHTCTYSYRLQERHQVGYAIYTIAFSGIIGVVISSIASANPDAVFAVRAMTISIICIAVVIIMVI